jgi:hypothetical protein
MLIVVLMQPALHGIAAASPPGAGRRYGLLSGTGRAPQQVRDPRK